MPTYTEHDLVADLEKEEGGYKYGFVTEMEVEKAPPGLTEDTVRFYACRRCEAKWWEREGGTISLSEVLSLASQRR
jgi:hypothetical protein